MEAHFQLQFEYYRE